MFFRSLLGSAALSLVLATGASAASFTADEAMTFAQCLAPLDALADEFEAEGTAPDLFSGDTHDLVVDGKVKPYSVPLDALKESDAAAYARVNTVAKDCGFKNAGKLGTVADVVMAAYMAKKTPPMAPGMGQMSPEMLQMMPPEARKGFELMTALGNVPAEDKALITGEVEAALDASISAEMGKTDMGNMGGMGGMQGSHGMPH